MDIMTNFIDVITTEPSKLHLVMMLLGSFIVLFGLISLFVKEKLYLTESLVATLIGIAIGPFGIKLVEPEKLFSDKFHYILLEFSRLVIAMQVMAVGVSTPGGYLKKHWPSVLILLGPVIIVMYLVSSLIVKLVLGFGWLESLIIGACVSPTDPVLAHSVVKGKFANRYIPCHLRHLLAVESGANDGLGFPLLMLPIWLIIYHENTRYALKHWAFHTWLYEIAFSILLGFLSGKLARFLLRKSEKHKLIDKESFLVFTIALTLFITGAVTLVGSDDLLAVYIAGNVFAWDQKFLTTVEDSHISQVIDMLFNITYFIFLGSIIPWKSFLEYGITKLIILSLLILALRRLPIVLLIKPWISALYTWREAFFCGWFGPMGVGAIFFSMMARSTLLASKELVDKKEYVMEISQNAFNVVIFLVLSSILIHGITVPITNFHLKKKAKRKVKKRAKLQLLESDQNEPAISANRQDTLLTVIIDGKDGHIMNQSIGIPISPPSVEESFVEEWVEESGSDSEREYIEDTPINEQDIPSSILIDENNNNQEQLASGGTGREISDNTIINNSRNETIE